MLPPGLHVDRVFVGAGNHVGAAPHHCLQRARTAREVTDSNIQPLVLEIPEALGKRKWQVIKRRLSAYCNMDIGLFDLRVYARGKRDRRKSGHRTKHRFHVYPHLV